MGTVKIITIRPSEVALKLAEKVIIGDAMTTFQERLHDAPEWIRAQTCRLGCSGENVILRLETESFVVLELGDAKVERVLTACLGYRSKNRCSWLEYCNENECK